MAVPVIDSINWDTFRYRPVYAYGTYYRGIFEWGFLYKESRVPQKELDKREHISEPYWWDWTLGLLPLLLLVTPSSHIDIIQAVFLYCCPDCPSYPARALLMGQATLAVWAAIKKCSYSIKCPNSACVFQITASLEYITHVLVDIPQELV